MSAAKLISRLDGVRQTSPSTYNALCPAHPDRHPSLTIREMDDGLVFVRCRTGCSFGEIVGAAGLDPLDVRAVKVWL